VVPHSLEQRGHFFFSQEKDFRRKAMVVLCCMMVGRVFSDLLLHE
jgi:hypothetical protein